MPNLVDCSVLEWKSVLPGIARPCERIQSGVNLAPLKVYQKAIRRNVDRGFIPGFCSIVISGDQVLHVDAYGFADIERRSPMRTDTLVRLYCMGKSTVAVALMVLVEQGRCTLEDEVAKFIPEFKNVRVVADSSNDAASPNDLPVRQGLTLKQLLSHVSGLGYGKELALEPEIPAERSYQGLVQGVELGHVTSIRDFCARLASVPLRRQPGDGFEYSHGLDVIGRVIEVASGKPLDKFLEEALFQPLGMVDTGFCVPASKLPRLAAIYGSIETAQRLNEPSKNQKVEHPWSLVRLDGGSPEDSAWAEGRHCPVFSGGGIMGHNQGGLVSTLNDQARFCLMLLSGGKIPGKSKDDRLLQESTVREMVSKDWLTDCLGGQQVNDGGMSGVSASHGARVGWNALGELGVEDDLSKLGPDAYEAAEYGYAGVAETFWSVNPKRNMVTLWFSQQVDNHSWTSPEANLWIAGRKAVAGVAKRPATHHGSKSETQEERGETKGRSRSPPRRRVTGKRLSGKQPSQINGV